MVTRTMGKTISRCYSPVENFTEFVVVKFLFLVGHPASVTFIGTSLDSNVFSVKGLKNSFIFNAVNITWYKAQLESWLPCGAASLYRPHWWCIQADTKTSQLEVFHLLLKAREILQAFGSSYLLARRNFNKFRYTLYHTTLEMLIWHLVTEGIFSGVSNRLNWWLMTSIDYWKSIAIYERSHKSSSTGYRLSI